GKATAVGGSRQFVQGDGADGWVCDFGSEGLRAGEVSAVGAGAGVSEAVLSTGGAAAETARARAWDIEVTNWAIAPTCN
ncbi:MAG: hypothetical protein AAGB13_17795, partial [Cyanobacteria bacterium P01_F01_bin.33]